MQLSDTLSAASCRRALVVVILSALRALSVAADDSHPGTAKKGPSGALFGRIVDAERKSLAGAEVRLFRYDSGRFAVVQPPVNTDATGAYRFAGLPESHFTLSVEKQGLARSFHVASIEDDQQIEVDVVLKPPASPVIRLTDEAGKPIAGAQLREYRQRGANGGDYMTQIWLREFGMLASPSDESGRLKLPALPVGDTVDVTIDHPDFAAVRVKDFSVAMHAEAKATMHPGVKVTFRLVGDAGAEPPSTAEISLFRDPFDSPSTMRLCELYFGASGIAHATVEAGNYSFLRLEHESFYLTPHRSPRTAKSQFLKIEAGRNDELQFAVHRKVPARGRVIDGQTGRPLRGMSVLGEIPNRAPGGSKSEPEVHEKWFYAGWGETDDKGEYTVSVAAGPARVSFQGDSYIPDEDFVELTVAADGSTLVPDIKVRPLGKLTGVVKDADAKPVANAVVRFRGNLSWLQPTLSDENGRFEIDVVSVPKDLDTRERRLVQPIVAFDPHREFAGRADVRIDRPETVVVTLDRHAADWPMDEFENELGDWQRGIIGQEQDERQNAMSLRGQAPPELDGVLWLNTDGHSLTLADLRGKYVLLDFWSIGCGPCHADFPSVSLVHRLYKDRGLAVIAVHDNSQPPEAVRQHVAKLRLPFPVVVDHADGRTVTGYQRHGIAQGIPNYVLIGPDGTVLFDDRTIPAPTLRLYKIEIVRRLLLENRADRNGR
jgi:thiol-disulfide isomerase/thioredoxin